ncbi:MAG: HlyD family secretion protein, partial [Alphaproteobacteria bacterium]
MPLMRRHLLRLVLVIAVPAVLIAGGALLWLAGGRYVSTENAYVKNDILHVAAEVDGRVVEIGARDHALVAAGDLLFRIDPEPHAIALARAEAELGAVAYRIEGERAEYRVAAAEIGEAEARVRFSERQVERLRSLQARGAATAVQFDEARLQLEVARDRVAVIRA